MGGAQKTIHIFDQGKAVLSCSWGACEVAA
jgi:hypothetical protein